MPIETVGHALPGLLRLGANAEVLAPADLRDRVKQTLLAMARFY